MPLSAKVGTSGSAGERFDEATPSARTLPDLDLRQRGVDAHRRQLHLAGQQRLDGRGAAFVGDVHHVEPARRGAEQFDGQVRAVARAGRRIGELARLALRQRHELRGVLRGNRRVDHDHGREGGRQRDRREVLEDVVGQLRAVQRGRDGMRAVVGHHQRVAVGRRLGDQRAAHRAAGARLVLHHDLLADPFRQLLRQDAAERVGVAARRVRHDQPDRPRRKGCRLRGGGQGGGAARAVASLRIWRRGVRIMTFPLAFLLTLSQDRAGVDGIAQHPHPEEARSAVSKGGTSHAAAHPSRRGPADRSSG